MNATATKPALVWTATDREVTVTDAAVTARWPSGAVTDHMIREAVANAGGPAWVRSADLQVQGTPTALLFVLVRS
mgnify:FL=1